MIHALPGMGADRRMFPSPWDTLPGFVAHDWTPYQGERSIAELAASVVVAYDIRDGDSLVGASLGGMVACEVAKLRRLQHIYLIGSALNPSEVHRLLLYLTPMAKVTPFRALQAAAKPFPSEVASMFVRADPGFLRSMCGAIARWPGLSNPVRLHRIHGRKDRLIPLPKKVDLVIEGGHLIAMTHPWECVRSISDLADQPDRLG